MKETLYCTMCGTANVAEANFCFNCGQPITKALAETSNSEAFVPVEEPAPAIEQRWDNDAPLQSRAAQNEAAQVVQLHSQTLARG